MCICVYIYIYIYTHVLHVEVAQSSSVSLPAMEQSSCEGQETERYVDSFICLFIYVYICNNSSINSNEQ